MKINNTFLKLFFPKAIVGFRETERKHWNPVNSEIIARIRSVSFDPTHRILPHVHVLDLAKDGHIKPHVDSVRVSIARPLWGE